MHYSIFSKIVTATALLLILISCSKNKAESNILPNKIVGIKWRCIEYKRNGTIDAFVVTQQPTFEFRNDGKMYFSQINPVEKDTLNYQFLNDTNIKVTWPKSITVVLNYRIDLIESDKFNFTVTTNENGNMDEYKTVKQ